MCVCLYTVEEIYVRTFNKFFGNRCTLTHACKNKCVNYKNKMKIETSFYINIYI